MVNAVARTIKEARDAASQPPAAVGIAIPGHINDQTGVVAWSPNFGDHVNGIFVNWRNVQFRGPLAALVDIPIRMGNDANLAALGEYRFGSGKNSAKCLVMFTLGTGVGSGVVMSPDAVQGKAEGPLIVVGGNKGAVELGHTIVNWDGPDCTAGEYGSLEGYLGRDAMVRRAINRLERGRESVLREMVGGDLSQLTPLHLSQAADKGDEVAIEVFEEVGTILGIGIANSIVVFAPDIVAIGGQVAKAGEWIMGPARKAARNAAIPSLFADAKIVVAEQIAEAGMMGAAALAFQNG